MTTTKLTEEIVRQFPKVLLHEHLDGTIRPGTIVDLARDAGMQLPTPDAQGMADWFHRGADRKSLGLYLEGFGVTIGLMQTAEGLERIGYESILDAATENIVYQEIRFHPGYHTAKGLSLEGVMNAVIAGMKRGEAETGVKWGIIICAMRNMDPQVSMEMAELAMNYRNRGVVGFDLAGEEAGHPPKHHVEAFR